MRKKFVIMPFLLIIFLLAACQPSHYDLGETDTIGGATTATAEGVKQPGNDVNTVVDEGTGTGDETAVENGSLGVVDSVTQPNGITYYAFDSYEGLVSHFSSIATSENSMIQAQKSLYNEKYEAFVTALTNSKQIVVPMLGDEVLPLEYREGAEITLFTKDSWQLPWIWYHCMYQGQRVSIKVTYPTGISRVEYASGATCADVLRQLNENAVNVHNYREFDIYKNVCSTEIQLRDMKASAIGYEFKDATKAPRVSIYYKDFLITVSADSSILKDASFWNALSFEPLS